MLLKDLKNIPRERERDTSFIKYQRDATFSVYLVFYNSTCFARSLRPSSGVIYKL